MERVSGLGVVSHLCKQNGSRLTRDMQPWGTLHHCRYATGKQNRLKTEAKRKRAFSLVLALASKHQQRSSEYCLD